MKIKEITQEEDVSGKWKCIEYHNGYKIRLLRSPSEVYLRKTADYKAARKLELDKLAEVKARENLIQDEMREMAMVSLQEKGELPEDLNTEPEPLIEEAIEETIEEPVEEPVTGGTE